jgi:hypothetical protein
MSLLPQRKKSADEIAKLRESLGIPALAPATGELPVEPAAQMPVAPEILNAATTAADVKFPEPLETTPSIAPIPAPVVREPKEVRSLKRSERIPVLPVDGMGPLIHLPGAPEPLTIPASSPLPVDHGPKQVRSLRKSEQVPLPAIERPKPSVDSKLPVHSHSDREISEIRRQEAIAMQAPPVHPRSLSAHPALVIPGYLFALTGAACFYHYELDLEFTAACVVIALLFAGYIFFKKPLSRHHAAFISVAALFVIVFGAVHYFPQIQHGT